MRKLLAGFALAMMVFSCTKSTLPSAKVKVDGVKYASYGEKFIPTQVLSADEMLGKYEKMAVGDSLTVSFKGTVKSVCQSEGCWMRVGLNDKNKESFVRFKNHAFFIPKDSDGAEAIVKGKAFKKETSVAELKHYAEDAGKSAEEIAKITEPKVEFTFKADGVLLKK